MPVHEVVGHVRDLTGVMGAGVKARTKSQPLTAAAAISALAMNRRAITRVYLSTMGELVDWFKTGPVDGFTGRAPVWCTRDMHIWWICRTTF